MKFYKARILERGGRLVMKEDGGSILVGNFQRTNSRTTSTEQFPAREIDIIKTADIS